MCYLQGRMSHLQQLYEAGGCPIVVNMVNEYRQGNGIYLDSRRARHE